MIGILALPHLDESPVELHQHVAGDEHSGNEGGNVTRYKAGHHPGFGVVGHVIDCVVERRQV